MAECCRGLTVDLQFDLGYSVFMTSPWVAMEDINFKDKIFMIGKYTPPPEKLRHLLCKKEFKWCLIPYSEQEIFKLIFGNFKYSRNF